MSIFSKNSISNGMVEIFIGVGSNMGDRKGNIRKALKSLVNTEEIAVKQVSSLMETDPVGGPPSQPKYINGVIRAETFLSPRKLLGVLQKIEEKLGRVRTVRFGPRTIDLDILLYGKKIIDEPGLKIPHPRMHKRQFALKPLLELAPEFEDFIQKVQFRRA